MKEFSVRAKQAFTGRQGGATVYSRLDLEEEDNGLGASLLTSPGAAGGRAPDPGVGAGAGAGRSRAGAVGTCTSARGTTPGPGIGRATRGTAGTGGARWARTWLHTKFPKYVAQGFKDI